MSKSKSANRSSPRLRQLEDRRSSRKNKESVRLLNERYQSSIPWVDTPVSKTESGLMTRRNLKRIRRRGETVCASCRRSINGETSPTTTQEANGLYIALFYVGLTGVTISLTFGPVVASLLLR